VATACGLATLKEISQAGLLRGAGGQDTLAGEAGLDRRGAAGRRALVGDSEGGMFGFFFTAGCRRTTAW
jgi:glutamate-1-semialdehyde 2,1-aminomutase